MRQSLRTTATPLSPTSSAQLYGTSSGAPSSARWAIVIASPEIQFPPTASPSLGEYMERTASQATRSTLKPQEAL